MLAAAKPFRRAVGLIAAVLGVAAVLSGCGSGDSTVAKTPSAASASAAPSRAAGAPGTTATPGTSTAPNDPCAVNLAAPAIAKAVSELPRDPRSQQPWNPEPLAGNYSQCAELSAVIVKANTNAEYPSTRAMLFHLGQYLPQAVPDTYGFNGIDLDRCTADTVALQHPTGVSGLNGVVKFHWNGTSVEIVSTTGG